MRNHKHTRVLFVIALSALLLLAFTAARLTAGYDLPWWTVEGGGGGGGCYQSASGYALCGAVGQAEAGGGSGSGFQVQSGFWVGSRLVRYQLMLPMIRR
jgi:hypothetical protein